MKSIVIHAQSSIIILAKGDIPIIKERAGRKATRKGKGK